MKVKILRGDRGKWYHNTDNIGKEFLVDKYHIDMLLEFRIEGGYWVDRDDCVITELPESFCVQRCDDNNPDDWNKYIQWLNKQKNYPIPMFGGVSRYKYYGVDGENLHSDYLHPFGVEIHIDDMIKHIDYMESQQHIQGGEQFSKESQLIAKMDEIIKQEEFVDADGQQFVIGAWYEMMGQVDSYRKCSSLPTNDKLPYLVGVTRGTYKKNDNEVYATQLSRFKRVPDYKVEKYLPKDEFDLTTDKGRLAYARKHYPIGTRYIPLYRCGERYNTIIGTINYNIITQTNGNLEGGNGFIYANGNWAEIIKENKNMNTQKLSRKGLKEIHSVACSAWKTILEDYGKRNPLEDYIELTQEEVNEMFNACTKEQLPIVSKYLKQDDGSVDVTKFTVARSGIGDNNYYIIRDREHGEFSKKSFLLSDRYNWEIKKDELGQLCLIPTKKK